VRFFESYVDTIIALDLAPVARVHDHADVRRLLSAMASTSASLLNLDGLSRDLGMPSNTVRSYAALLETLFLVARSEAWSSNLLSRAVEAPTVYIADSGLHGYLVGADASRIVGAGQLAGMMFRDIRGHEVAPPGRLAGRRGSALSRPRSRPASRFAASGRPDPDARKSLSAPPVTAPRNQTEVEVLAGVVVSRVLLTRRRQESSRAESR